jgi:hypothetical protein
LFIGCLLKIGVSAGANADFKETAYELQQRKSHSEGISTCSSRYRPTLPSAISCAGSKAGPRIAFRWSSSNFVSGTGDATSGPEATSAPKRQHHGRCHNSVYSIARTYRRQPVDIQFVASYPLFWLMTQPGFLSALMAVMLFILARLLPYLSSCSRPACVIRVWLFRIISVQHFLGALRR